MGPIPNTNPNRKASPLFAEVPREGEDSAMAWATSPTHKKREAVVAHAKRGLEDLGQTDDGPRPPTEETVEEVLKRSQRKGRGRAGSAPDATPRLDPGDATRGPDKEPAGIPGWFTVIGSRRGKEGGVGAVPTDLAGVVLRTGPALSTPLCGQIDPGKRCKVEKLEKVRTTVGDRTQTKTRFYVIEPIVGWASAKFLSCASGACRECGRCMGSGKVVVADSDAIVTMNITTSPGSPAAAAPSRQMNEPSAVLGYTANTDVSRLPTVTPRQRASSIEIGSGAVQVVARSESAMRAMARGGGRETPLIAVVKTKKSRQKEEAEQRKAEADCNKEKKAKRSRQKARDRPAAEARAA